MQPEGRLQQIQDQFFAVNWLKLVKQSFPPAEWLLHYKVADLPYDLIAGFTVGMTLVPQCLSYAALANVRSEFGLYTSFLGQFVYFLLGTSKDGSVGPTSITAMMLGMYNGMYNPLVDEGDNTYNAVATFITGIVLIFVGLFRLGFIVNLFSIPVVSGFTSAAGFFIIGSQMKLLFGLTKAPNDSPSTFIKQMKNVYDRRHEIKNYDVTCGFVCIATLFLLQYMPLIIARIRRSKSKHEDSPLVSRLLEVVNLIAASRNAIVFVVSTGVAYHFYSQAENRQAFEAKLSLVGFIKPGLPTFQFPAMQIEANRTVLISLDEASLLPNSSLIVNSSGIYTRKLIVLKTASQIIGDLSAMIIIIPLMTLLENFAITKALGRKNGYAPNPTNEMLAVGLANFLQSFLNAFPATTTISRCALNDQCKVKTQLGSLLSATIVMITLAYLTPLFYYIPKPTLAAIMICAGVNLIDFKIAVHMYHESPKDAFVLAASFLLCLLYDIAYGVLIILLLHMVVFLRPLMMIKLHVSQRTLINRQKLTVIRLPHGMEYPSCDQFLEAASRVFKTSENKNVVIDCQFIARLDYSGIQAFRNLFLLAFKLDKHIVLTNLQPDVLKTFQRLALEHFNYVASIEEAVEEHMWASSRVDEGLAHIASIVLPAKSARRIIFKNSVSDFSDEVFLPIKSHSELGRPLTTATLGTAWQPGGQLLSASLSSVWAVAALGQPQDQTVDQWEKTAVARHMSARASMAKMTPPSTDIDEEVFSDDYYENRRPSGLYLEPANPIAERRGSIGKRPVLGTHALLRFPSHETHASTTPSMDSIREVDETKKPESDLKV